MERGNSNGRNEYRGRNFTGGQELSFMKLVILSLFDRGLPYLSTVLLLKVRLLVQGPSTSSMAATRRRLPTLESKLRMLMVLVVLVKPCVEVKAGMEQQKMVSPINRI